MGRIDPQTNSASLLSGLDTPQTPPKFHGNLEDYLEFPNLEHLALEKVTLLALENTDIQNHDLKQLVSVNTLLKVPALRTITLDNMSIDHKFVEGLDSCKLLEVLILENCDIGDFPLPFLEFLQRTESLPCLETFHIALKPWPTKLGISLKKFKQRLAAIRPKVTTEKRDIWPVSNVISLFRTSHDLFFFNSGVYFPDPESASSSSGSTPLSTSPLG
jgi:hypothetical protein